jgi:hypothetical protein
MMFLSQDVGAANRSHVDHNGGVNPLTNGGHRHQDEAVVDSSMDSIPVHPLGIKPLGNQYFASERPARLALGPIGSLPDEIIQQLLEILDVDCLRTLGSTCRFLYAFCRLDELWKGLFLE